VHHGVRVKTPFCKCGRPTRADGSAHAPSSAPIFEETTDRRLGDEKDAAGLQTTVDLAEEGAEVGHPFRQVALVDDVEELARVGQAVEDVVDLRIEVGRGEAGDRARERQGSAD
jgi:hypothetical protein